MKVVTVCWTTTSTFCECKQHIYFVVFILYICSVYIRRHLRAHPITLQKLRTAATPRESAPKTHSTTSRAKICNKALKLRRLYHRG